MFHSHLWLGIGTAILVAMIALTGVFLNHKRFLGFMPDVAHDAPGSFEGALPLSELARLAAAALPPELAGTPVDRMDVRPDNGLVKVRFEDRKVTEVTLDLASGDVLHVGERNDVFLEKLHSGEIFGAGWILLSDFAGVGLIFLLVSGYWMWLYPRSRL